MSILEEAENVVVPTYYRWVIYVLLILIVLAACYALGWKGEHDRFTAYKAQQALLASQQEERIKQIEAAHQKLTEDTKNDYETRLANNSAYWRKRLLSLPPGSCPMPEASTAASGVTETATDALPDYSKLIMDCQATTVQLESLQAYELNLTKIYADRP